MYVCLSVTGLCIVYKPLWHLLLMSRIEDDARTSSDVWKMVNCSTRDERWWQEITRVSAPKRLTLLAGREWDRQKTVRRHLNSASSFTISSDRTFYVLRVRHMMHMRIHSTLQLVLLKSKNNIHFCVGENPVDLLISLYNLYIYLLPIYHKSNNNACSECDRRRKCGWDMP